MPKQQERGGYAWRAPRSQPATIFDLKVKGATVPFVLASVAQSVSTVMAIAGMIVLVVAVVVVVVVVVVPGGGGGAWWWCLVVVVPGGGGGGLSGSAIHSNSDECVFTARVHTRIHSTFAGLLLKDTSAFTIH